jgi:hypothetical protein
MGKDFNHCYGEVNRFFFQLAASASNRRASAA